MAGIPEKLVGAFRDRYVLERELGRGGMATVYLARDVKHDRLVALKLLRPELATAVAAERFLREIQVAARLAHPHILPLLDSGAADGSLYYTMPFVEGETLRARLRREKQVPLEDALRIASEVADALNYAHSREVVHRDIKPENILIEAGHAVVSDFGIARALTTAASQRLTETGLAIGSPAYMSPEQATAARDLDGRSDLYSLGCVLYEMLAGHPPFLGVTAREVLARHTLDPVPPLRTVRSVVPEGVERAVLRALAKTPADRFSTAAEFAAALKGGHEATRPRSRVVRRALAGAVVALAMLGFAVAWLLVRGREPNPLVSPTHSRLTFSGRAYSPAISPDGKRFAYGSDSAVLVQDLTSDQPITVHHAAGLPLRWSPDASEVLYSESTDSSVAIFLVPALGGTPRRIWHQLDSRGLPGPSASWSPDGSQVAVGCQRKLCLVNKSTGDTTSIALDTSFDWLLDLDWSSKTRSIAFVTKDRRARSAIWTITADGARKQKVVEDSLELLSPRWSPTGDAIYYLRGGAERRELCKVRVSARTGRPDGSPLTVATGLQPGGYFTLSGDGTRLLYTREEAYANLRLVTVDGRRGQRAARTTQVTTGTLAKWGPSVSPDGERVAFSMGDGAKANIYTMPIEGGPMRQITFFDAFSSGPVWSPDGRTIAFGSTQGGAPKVWTVDADGGPPRRFARTELDHNFSGTGKFQLIWSPESDILYQRGSANFRILNLVTEDERWLVENDSAGRGMGSPRFSPDGRKVAVRWWRPSPSLWLIARADLSQVLLRTYRDWFELLGWSADGRWIYVSDDETGNLRIARIPVGGGEPEHVAHLPFEPGLWGSMTANGKRFVFEVWEAQSDVWMVENFDR